MANIANGEMGIRGTINNIQHFLNDIKGFDGLTFELKGMDEVDFSQEHIDAEGKVRIYLPVKYRWSINVDEAKTISEKYDLSILPGRTLTEKLYLLFKGSQEYCVVCGKPSEFTTYFRGYNKTCSNTCKRVLDKQNLTEKAQITLEKNRRL